jgi:heptosyltransferase-2
MQNTKHKILVWLPSPMGDAILCTPTLRAIRKHFKSCEISFLAEPVVRELLSPGGFNNNWLEQRNNNPFAIARELKKHKFTHAILFKNSFGSALAVSLARIPLRTGYAREGRGFLLTDKLYPLKLSNGRFKPVSMIDYYLAISSQLGAETGDRTLELSVETQKSKKFESLFPELAGCGEPIIILVPGGTFGPSKCWPSERFAQTANWLITNYNATVVISVSQDPFEKQTAREICDSSKYKLINLAERPANLGELKTLFSRADLVISNDTGPRHIAIALQRKVITLFGPNDPAWTDIGYENEIQIVGNAPCAPCRKPVCKKPRHLCMEAITVEMVCNAAGKLLANSKGRAAISACQRFIETSKLFFVDADYEAAMGKLGLTSIDAVFSFNAAKDLSKENLAPFRRRLQFEINPPSTPLEKKAVVATAPLIQTDPTATGVLKTDFLTGSTIVFLKRYDRPPVVVQLKNWLSHLGRKSLGFCEFESARELAAEGIKTPNVISHGEQWERFFEKRSFIITEKILNAESLERKLPPCFNGPATAETLKLQRKFIAQLASFVKKFHQTDYRHRDLYFSHIYYDDDGNFHLIDLARAFKPILLGERFRIKDVAQLYYSAPARYFSRTDRLRFYLCYAGQSKLTRNDKIFIRKVINKAELMARHDIKHGRTAPFAG